ncbi:MAG: hypothetical protein IPK10_19140 [Bacteroidetes bacterium]|nr:hypothetical protein [Bacteroidota bacterium]
MQRKPTSSNKFLTAILLINLFSLPCYSQENTINNSYGNTLNLGLGIGGYAGYYSYSGQTLPVLNINYEIDVAKDFTLAPFISYYSFSRSRYYGNNSQNHPYKNYTYREVVIPIGAKGTYYFDEILQANKRWDFYLASSIGFAIVNRSWDSDYYGDKNYYRHGTLYF